MSQMVPTLQVKQRCTGWPSTGDHCRCSYIVCSCYSTDNENACRELPFTSKKTSLWVSYVYEVRVFRYICHDFFFSCNCLCSTSCTDTSPIIKALAWLGQYLSPISANAVGQTSAKFGLAFDWKRHLEINNNQ